MNGLPRLADLLPEIYADDDFLTRFLAAFDEVLEPVHLLIDRLDRLADPLAAPEDVVDWLCFWLGWQPAEGWLPSSRRRALLRASGPLVRWRGTARGLAHLVEVLGGDDVVQVVIDEPGWVVAVGGHEHSPPPAATMPPDGVRVTVWGELAGAWDDRKRGLLERMVAAELPAGVRLTVNYRPPRPASATAPLSG